MKSLFVSLTLANITLLYGFIFPTMRKICNLHVAKESNPDDFIPKEFEDMIKVIKPSKFEGPDQDLLNDIQQSQDSNREELFRKYPFEDNDLPILPDCNNYWSGKYGESFWLQDSDQVFVYIPIKESVKPRDINVKFEAKRVVINTDGEESIIINCSERIIPDGSFWTIEEDKSGKRFIQLDMEKRFRMINWKNLFSDPLPEDPVDIQKQRSVLLEKLYAANKGMSKISPGTSPETMQEMMNNPDLMRMLNQEVNTTPQIINVKDMQGKPVEDFVSDDVIQELQDAIESQLFTGVEDISRTNPDNSNSENNNSQNNDNENNDGIIDVEATESDDK